jgi:hypothetical protein
MLVCDEWSMFFRTIGNMGGTAEADSFCPRDSSRDAGLGMKAFFIALPSLHPFRKDDILC